MKGPVRSLEISYFVHATEDPEKLARAASRLISGEPQAQVERMEGHHGNLILRVRLHLTGEEAQGAFDSLSSGMGSDLKDELLEKLGSHLDEHSSLIMRFDKQRFVSGSLSFGSADPVRVRVKPRPFLLGRDTAGFYAGLFGRL